MLVTALERERQQIFQSGLVEGKQEGRVEGKQEGLLEGKREGRVEGKQEGRVEGKQEGLLEGKIETAKVMFTKGMDLPLISEITNLPEEQLSQLKAEFSSVEK